MSLPFPTDAAARPPLLRFLMLVTLVVVAVTLWYLIRHHLQDEGEVRWFAPEAACDLHAGACTTSLGDFADLTFAIGIEGPIQALEILPLTLRLEGLETESATVTFVGQDMDMGLHRFFLAREGKGELHGTGQVAICTDAVMSWRARIVVETPRGRLGTWFDFDVERHG